MKFINNFRSIVKKYPKKIAINFGNKKISYKEFYELINKIIFYLKKNDVKILSIFEDNKQIILSYAAMFACLINGTTYIPINSKTPRKRLEKILNISKCKFILINKKIKLSKKIKIINKNNFKNYKSSKIEIKKKNNNSIAYIIFTSGSSGEPKGVIISVRSLNHYINWIIKAFYNDRFIRSSQHPSIGFDLSVADIYGTLCSGGELFPVKSIQNQIYLNDFINNKKLTHWISVPSLIDFISIKNNNFQNLSSLKKMFFCGEVLKKKSLEKLFSINNRLKILNTYGPTECTVSCSSIKLNANNYIKYCKPSISIGKPINNMKFNLRNPKKNIGELEIGGPQVSLGYLNAINKNIFFKNKKINWYTTGDICKKINKNFYFIKRKDRQVKFKGNRIELDEIDKTIEDQIEGNAYTSIINGKIVSFISSKYNKLFLINTLKKSLPSYMIPTDILYIKKFPKNINNKVNIQKIIQKYNDQKKNR